MIRVRFKTQPHVVKEFDSRRDIVDMENWGLVLEILHDDADPKNGVEGNTAKGENPSPEAAPEESDVRKRKRRKTSTESDSAGEQA